MAWHCLAWPGPPTHFVFMHCPSAWQHGARLPGFSGLKLAKTMTTIRPFSEIVDWIMAVGGPKSPMMLQLTVQSNQAARRPRRGLIWHPT